MPDIKLLQNLYQYPKLRMRSQQTGVALMVVLLLVVSITILAGSMLASQKITTRKSGLLFNQDRLLQHIGVGEQLAVRLIQDDMKVNDFDSLQDVWAQEIPAVKTSDGYKVELTIKDASARFNLNNLYHDGAVDEQALTSFQRLLDALNLDTQLAVMILDWQDPDNLVHQDGGEESVVYTNSDAPKPIANQPFISVDQLNDLPGITAETVATLRPYVTAVPYWLPMNVNTADELVMKSIVGEANNQAIQKLIKQRENQPISSKEALKALNLFENSDDANQTTKNKKQNNSNKKESDKEENPANDNSKDEEKEKEQGKNNKKEQAKKEALLSVESKAFEVLISVHNDDKANPKSRFATVMIAKGDILGDIEYDSNNNQSHMPMINSETDKNKVQVKTFFRRMWAFRPQLPI